MSKIRPHGVALALTLAGHAAMHAGCVGTLEGAGGGGHGPLPEGVDGGRADSGRLPGDADDSEAFHPVAAGLRTLTPAQYRQSVSDVLGLTEDQARDAPIERVGQWGTSVAAASGGFAATTIEHYEASARSTAAWALAPERRMETVGCTPVARVGDACITAFVTRIGRRAFRRSLSAEEVTRWSGVALTVSEMLSDPWRGVEYALAGILQSPNFLYRVELGTDDPMSDDPARLRYTSDEMATRLAYLVWGSTPDEALLDAAARGELESTEGLSRALNRMLADPRAEVGLEEFVADLLQANSILAVTGDASHPDFEGSRQSMRDSLVRTATEAARTDGIASMFTTRTTFVDARLASILGLEGAFGTALQRVELPASSPRAGVLTTPGFLATHAYPTKPSPTLRGLFIRKRFLCGEILPPPPGTDTRLPESLAGRATTARERLAVHQAVPSCAGCHVRMDPIGLGLENFDEIGAFRTMEQGLRINPSDTIDGVPFADAVGLGHAVSTHPAFLPCVAARFYEFASGTQVVRPTAEMTALSANDPTELIRATALSEIFRFAWMTTPGDGT